MGRGLWVMGYWLWVVGGHEGQTKMMDNRPKTRVDTKNRSVLCST